MIIVHVFYLGQIIINAESYIILYYSHIIWQHYINKVGMHKDWKKVWMAEIFLGILMPITPETITHHMNSTHYNPNHHLLTHIHITVKPPSTSPKKKIKFLHPELQKHSGWCLTLISHDVSRLSSALNFSIPTMWPFGTEVVRHRRGHVRRWMSPPHTPTPHSPTPTPLWTAIAKKKKKKGETYTF